MALISCPECGKEISDKAKKCIHCGRNFEKTTGEPEKIICSECGAELEAGAEACTSCGCPVCDEKWKETKTKDGNKARYNKKMIVAGLIAVCVVLLIIVGISINRSYQAKKAYNEYVDTLQLAETTMLAGASEAEDLTNLTARVWRNAIYEEKDSATDKYVCPGGVFVDDFNTALLMLYLDDSTTRKTDDISENQEAVQGYMKKLQDVPEGLERCYETVNDLYDAYGILVELALNPTGNYNSFTESTRNAASDFVVSYKKLDSQIPDKK